MWWKEIVLDHPKRTLAALGVVAVFFFFHIFQFYLDASADSLVLEHDDSLEYYRSVRAVYGSDDYLILTYTPKAELFTPEVLADIKLLRDKIAAIEHVESVTSILDVPLVASPPMTLEEVSKSPRTLADKDIDLALAKQELLNSPLYRDLLVSRDGTTAVILINFGWDETYFSLLGQRNYLRKIRFKRDFTEQEEKLLKEVSSLFEGYSRQFLAQQARNITKIRHYMDQHRGRAEVFLGGVPMIISDSMAYIQSDLLRFGGLVLGCIAFLLAVFFKRLCFVVLPLLTSLLVTLIMVGVLGFMRWPVTVVSSNFVALLLIITLSLTVHIIVRYNEFHRRYPKAAQREILSHALTHMVKPCFYTALTTAVAFGSLVVSDVRPVIDFGWIMGVGIAVAFLCSFTFFPALLMLMPASKPIAGLDITAKITGFCAQLVRRRGKEAMVVFLVMIGTSLAGLSFLTVENRFIDYFKPSTEIYQGLTVIDHKLGGTTPLDVILDAPESYVNQQKKNYWFNSFMLEEVALMHDYLDELSETGKVISISTALRLLDTLKDQKDIDSFYLAVLRKKLPAEVKEILFDPYLSEDGNQLRFSVRVFESDPTLKRQQLLNNIRHDLIETFALAPEQLHLSGMLVLYNNVLQSLFRSQILTIGVVFTVILALFVVIFGSVKQAWIAIIPNISAAIFVLGVMGWLGIALDVMTITIAAICIGIAVDDTIHYMHRFKAEFAVERNYWVALKQSHQGIGRAMYYTMLTITLGFSVLVFSNFVPTIYFGMLTGCSMVIALILDLIILPLLIVYFKPFGAET